MTGPPRDTEAPDPDSLKRLVLQLLEEVASVTLENARLKGLTGRPKIKPSGMEAARAGSRFKGYEDYVVQALTLRPHVIRFRRERWRYPYLCCISQGFMTSANGRLWLAPNSITAPERRPLSSAGPKF